jgi:hypothetical protein
MKNTLTLVHSSGRSANPEKRMLRLISSPVEGANLPVERLGREPTRVARNGGAEQDGKRPQIVECSAVESYKQMIAIIGAGDVEKYRAVEVWTASRRPLKQPATGPTLVPVKTQHYAPAAVALDTSQLPQSF